MLEPVLKWIGDGFMWIIENGASWIVENGIHLVGDFSRFMVNEVSESFLLFALVGMFVYVAGGHETGLKMVNKSIIFYFVCMILGVVC